MSETEFMDRVLEDGIALVREAALYETKYGIRVSLDFSFPEGPDPQVRDAVEYAIEMFDLSAGEGKGRINRENAARASVLRVFRDSWSEGDKVD